MDFALVLDDNNRPQATLGQADELLNAVLLSLHIKRGSFFLNPDFGSRLHEIKSTSESDVALARQYVEESLEWLVGIKKIDKLDVTVTPERGGRLNIRIVLGVKIITITWGDAPPSTPRFNTEAKTTVGAAALGVVDIIVSPGDLQTLPLLDVSAEVIAVVGAGAIVVVDMIVPAELPELPIRLRFVHPVYQPEIDRTTDNVIIFNNTQDIFSGGEYNFAAAMGMYMCTVGIKGVYNTSITFTI